MRVIWTMACVGYSLHIFNSLDTPMVGFDPHGWWWFSFIAGFGYLGAGVACLFKRELTWW